MLSRQVYTFPKPETDIRVFEEAYLQLLPRYRDGQLSDEEKDIFDYANNVLLSKESHNVS